MNYEKYLFMVEKKLRGISNCIILKCIEERGMKIDLLADFSYKSSNLFNNKLSPFLKYEILEKYYIKHFDNITTKEIQGYFDFLHLILNEHVPTFQHLQESINGIMICNHADRTCIDFVKSLKYSKPFSIYFKGWKEIKIILIDLNENEIYYNDDDFKINDLFLFK